METVDNIKENSI